MTCKILESEVFNNFLVRKSSLLITNRKTVALCPAQCPAFLVFPPGALLLTQIPSNVYKLRMDYVPAATGGPHLVHRPTPCF